MMKHKRKILSLCDHTGNMVRDWADAGVECWTVDLRGAKETFSGRRHIVADVRDWTIPEGVCFEAVFAFPPCTHLAVSGARWFKEKGLRALAEAIDVFGACVNLCEGQSAPWMIENPVSTVSTYWRKPDFTFHPCDYGDPYTKKTCLWAGNGFTLPPRKRVRPHLGSLMHKVPPSPDRANIRSATPKGFARAVFAHLYRKAS